MLKIGVLCSGALGLNTLEKIDKEYPIEFILTDNKSTGIIDIAKKQDIPYFAGNPRNGQGFNFIKNFNVDVIASINYLFLIEEDIINHSNLLTFNIHGSLLPKYRGRTPHVWAIINGEKRAGITAHLIDAGCDTGKIIHQIEIPINEEDTGAIMLQKYEKEYFPLVKKVLEDAQNGNLNLRIQNEEIATYYGKRTPDDGLINWDWKGEQIRNWIRAQAAPYPGAFTFFEGKKVIIDKVSFSPELPKEKFKNGEIIKTSPKVQVKVKDGLITLDTLRNENSNFIKGNVFSNEN